MKYPRTLHLPNSPGATRDDRMHSSFDSFKDRQLIVTEKMDGSNVCMMHEDCFARSHGHSPKGESFDAFKALHARVKYNIPVGVQLFGEWCYAKHSIHYTDLFGYFMLFGARESCDGSSVWLSWEDTKAWANKLGLVTVPEIIRVYPTNKVDVEKTLASLARITVTSTDTVEGFVVRWYDSFKDEDFEQAVGKWVRKDHVQTDEHWSTQEIVKNKLRGSA